MSVCVAVFTCGRKDYLTETLASLHLRVRGFQRVVIFDDSGDPTFREWLRTLDVSVADWGRQRGFGGSISRAWMWLGRHIVEDHILHLEEDFTFDEPIDLADLVAALETDDNLDQMALLRHACFPREHRAGGIVQQNPDAHRLVERDGARWFEQQLVFTTNPSVYRRSLCDVGWPDVPRSEREFTRQRVAAGQKFGYWDARELVTHIGEVRTGQGY